MLLKLLKKFFNRENVHKWYLYHHHYYDITIGNWGLYKVYRCHDCDKHFEHYYYQIPRFKKALLAKGISLTCEGRPRATTTYSTYQPAYQCPVRTDIDSDGRNTERTSSHSSKPDA